MGIKRWDKKEEAPFFVLFLFVHAQQIVPMDRSKVLFSKVAKTCGRRGCCKMI